MDWFTNLFSGEDFVPRSDCGQWTTGLILLHVISDSLIWLAYISISLAIAYFVRRKKDLPFPHVFWLFAAFIVICGTTQIVDVMMFWHPAYRLAGVLKAVTAAVSLMTVWALLRVMPLALLIRSPKELELEVEARTGELARANQRFRALIDCITDAVWTRDPYGNFATRQESWEKYTGQTWDQYRDSGWLNAIHPEDRAAVVSNWQVCVATLTEHKILKRVWHAESNEYRYCEGRAVPIFDANDDLVEWIGMLADQHDRIEGLHRLKAEAEAKDNFMAMLAHELRNPLAPIQNCVTILRKDKDQEILAWARDTIERQVQHMARLVDDLLDVSRLMRGKVELKLTDTDLTTVLFRAIETVKPLIEGPHHKLILALPNGPIMRFHADEVRLAQVVSNLLSNSAKYTPERGTICLTGENDDATLTIRVRDNGIGISEDHIHRVFDPFYQVDNSLDRSKGGLGIGLALVKSLVELHNGTIEVTSQPQAGSEFVVRLPLQRAANMDTQKQVPSEKVYRILVVDDNIDAAKSLAVMLRYEGHETQCVFNGAAAIEVCQSFTPHVVLLDIGLPEMNGYEVCKHLRTTDHCKDYCIIAMTGYDTDEYRRLSKEAGMNDHLVKPVTYPVLIETVRRYLADGGCGSGT